VEEEREELAAQCKRRKRISLVAPSVIKYEL
jgi:hypothetical protein